MELVDMNCVFRLALYRGLKTKKVTRFTWIVVMDLKLNRQKKTRFT